MPYYAIVQCVCATCEEPFESKMECETEEKAESMRKWLTKHRKECPSCFKKAQKARAEHMLQELGAPNIHGSSEKQVNYASYLRERYIQEHLEDVQYAKVQLDKINPRNIPTVSAVWGLEENVCVLEAFLRVNLYPEYVCLTETSATIIISALKDLCRNKPKKKSVLGEMMVRRRNELKLSVDSVAMRLKTGTEKVESWEKGIVTPDLAQLPKIADALECTIDELLGRNGNSSDTAKK